MGLLDFNLDDPQTVGLLAMGAKMMADSGPSLTPRSFGQIFGGGLMGGMQAVQDSQRNKLLQQHMGMQNDMLGMQKKQMELALAKQQRMEDAYKGFYSGQPQVAADPAGMPAATGDNPAFPRQAMPDWMPQQAPAAAPTAAAKSPTADNYTRHLQFAQYLESKGLGEEAQKYYDLAEKFKPEFATEPRVVMGPDGKPMLVQMAKDGTVRPIQGGYSPAEKLSFHNLGGQTVGVDPYTGKPVANMKNSMSPDSVASNQLGWANFGLSKQRFAQEVSQQNQPQVMNIDGVGVIRVPKQGGEASPVLMGGKPLTSEKPLTESQGKAVTFASRMENADRMINDLVGKGVKTPSLVKQSVEGIWGVGDTLGAVANKFASPEQQMMEQSQRDFINAILRQESGASISPSEFDNARKQYFPQPNDDTQTIALKARNRQIAIQGMQTQAGPGAAKASSIAAKPASSGGWSIQKVE